MLRARAGWLALGLFSLTTPSTGFAQQQGVAPDSLAPFPAAAPVADSPPATLATPAGLGTEAGPGFKPLTIGIEVGVITTGGTIGATLFFNGSTALRAELGISATTAPLANPGFGVSVSAALRKYLLRYDRVHLFLEPGFFASNPLSKFNFGLEGSIGVEIYIFDRFSVGGHTGVALAFADTAVGTATSSFAVKLTTASSALFAAFYF